MSRIAPEALPYQSPLVQVRDEPLPWLLRLWPFGTAALLLALVTISAFLPIDVVVTAQGRIVTDDPPVVLKPMSPAVLQSLLVRPGDAVVAGQRVARLDTRVPDADAAVLGAERAAVTARIARIEAELAGRRVSGDTPGLDVEGRLQAERAAAQAARRKSLAAELAGLDRAIEAAHAEGPALAASVATARELEAMRSDLLSRRNGTRVALVEARLTRLDAETRARGNAARLTALAKEREATAARLDAFESELRERRLDELSQLQPRLRMIEEKLVEAQGLARLHELAAPQAGIVLSVAEGGPGSLMTLADPVVVIAPTGGPMHAEMELLSRDAGLVAPGDPVRIRVDAFPWRHHGLIEARLSDVAPSSTVSSAGGPARHAARAAFLAETGLPAGLMPGMTLTGDIVTGHRTILGYFLDPLLDGLGDSLREPRP